MEQGSRRRCIKVRDAIDLKFSQFDRGEQAVDELCFFQVNRGTQSRSVDEFHRIS